MKFWILIALTSLFGGHEVLAKECESLVEGKLRALSPSTAGGAEIVWRNFFANATGEYQYSTNPMINMALQSKLDQEVVFNFNVGFKYKSEQEALEKALLVKPAADQADNVVKEKGRGIKLGDTHVKLGLRALNFSSKTSQGDLWDLGFMTFTLNDKLLLDERGLGVSYKKPLAIGQVHLFSGAVFTQLVREGKSCISQNTFLASDSEETVGNLFAGAFLYWNVQGPPTPTGPAAAVDEEEFIPVEASQPEIRPALWGAGLLFNGNQQVEDGKLYFDLYHRSSVGTLVDYSAEVAVEKFQQASSLGYYLKLFKTFTTGNNQIIRPQVGFSSFHLLNGKQAFAPENSNLFLGEIMQFTPTGKDIVFYGFTYVINDDWSAAINQYGHYGNAQERELNSDLQYHFGQKGYFKVSYNYVKNSPFIKKDFSQWGVEVRWFL